MIFHCRNVSSHIANICKTPAYTHDNSVCSSGELFVILHNLKWATLRLIFI